MQRAVAALFLRIPGSKSSFNTALSKRHNGSAGKSRCRGSHFRLVRSVSEVSSLGQISRLHEIRLSYGLHFGERERFRFLLRFWWSGTCFSYVLFSHDIGRIGSVTKLDPVAQLFRHLYCRNKMSVFNIRVRWGRFPSARGRSCHMMQEASREK